MEEVTTIAPWHKLPKVPFDNTLTYLQPNDLLSLALVCRDFYHMISDSTVPSTKIRFDRLGYQLLIQSAEILEGLYAELIKNSPDKKDAIDLYRQLKPQRKGKFSLSNLLVPRKKYRPIYVGLMGLLASTLLFAAAMITKFLEIGNNSILYALLFVSLLPVVCCCLLSLPGSINAVDKASNRETNDYMETTPNLMETTHQEILQKILNEFSDERTPLTINKFESVSDVIKFLEVVIKKEIGAESFDHLVKIIDTQLQLAFYKERKQHKITPLISKVDKLLDKNPTNNAELISKIGIYKTSSNKFHQLETKLQAPSTQLAA